MDITRDTIHQAFDDHLKTLDMTRALEPRILETARLITDCFTQGRRLLLFGNGGSAADAQHIAAEFSGRFLRDREPWDAIALSVNTSVLTAVGNDYSYNDVFSRQVRAHGRAGDVLFGISTSGNSGNVIKAFEVGRERGLSIVGMTGESGGKMAPLCDLLLDIPSRSTPRIQEMHILVGHIICHLVEDALCQS